MWTPPPDPQWIQDLYKSYQHNLPILTWMFSVQEGWKGLVTQLIQDVVAVCPEIEIVQIKEKFGGLRFYYQTPDGTPQEVREAIWPLTQKAETESYSICEVCGAPGEPRQDGWVQTLCGVCYEKYKVVLNARGRG